MENKLETELKELLNRHSAETASGTPDFILAHYLINCLKAYAQAVRQRDSWFSVRFPPRPPGGAGDLRNV